MLVPRSQAAGIVLCGGKSQRMGQPKAFLPIAGTPMIGHVTRALRTVFDEVIVVAAPGGVDHVAKEIGDPQIRYICDDVPQAGPLAGIAAGLEAMSTTKQYAYVTACDLPRQTSQWILGMLDLLQPHVDIVIPSAGGRLHPLAGVYRRTVAASARRLLDQGRRRALSLIDLHPTRRVGEEELRAFDPQLAALQNVNTPADFAKLLREWDQLLGMEKPRNDS